MGVILKRYRHHAFWWPSTVSTACHVMSHDSRVTTVWYFTGPKRTQWPIVEVLEDPALPSNVLQASQQLHVWTPYTCIQVHIFTIFAIESRNAKFSTHKKLNVLAFLNRYSKVAWNFSALNFAQIVTCVVCMFPCITPVSAHFWPQLEKGP